MLQLNYDARLVGSQKLNMAGSGCSNSNGVSPFPDGTAETLGTPGATGTSRKNSYGNMRNTGNICNNTGRSTVSQYIRRRSQQVSSALRTSFQQVMSFTVDYYRN
jgi:hypothetical protein